MGLYLIAGSSGTGKSTMCAALKERGFRALDIDDDGLARWQHKETGYIHPKSSVKPHQRTVEFLGQHDWNVPRETLESLKDETGDQATFICGAIANIDAVADLFTTIFALNVDEATLRHRLLTRTTNDWGKQPHELAQTLRWHKATNDSFIERGAIMIDATGSTDDTVAEILDYLKLPTSSLK
nr:AAA domain protein [uncultured bacterium]